MIELSNLITAISVIVAIGSAIIAYLAEKSARDIEKRIILSELLAMYADIAYGDLTNWHPWDVTSGDLRYPEHMKWVKRFLSYNGRINNVIADDYDYICKKYVDYPKDKDERMTQVPQRRKKIQDFAKIKVKKIGAKLRDNL